LNHIIVTCCHILDFFQTRNLKLPLVIEHIYYIKKEHRQNLNDLILGFHDPKNHSVQHNYYLTGICMNVLLSSFHVNSPTLGSLHRKHFRRFFPMFEAFFDHWPHENLGEGIFRPRPNFRAANWKAKNASNARKNLHVQKRLPCRLYFRISCIDVKVITLHYTWPYFDLGNKNVPRDFSSWRNARKAPGLPGNRNVVKT